jgi:hypothetical protein
MLGPSQIMGPWDVLILLEGGWRISLARFHTRISIILFTYRDQRLKGWPLLRGLVSFYLICGLGLIANVGVAGYFAQHERWWVAGVVGVVVGSVWNYSISSVFTWKPRR